MASTEPPEVESREVPTTEAVEIAGMVGTSGALGSPDGAAVAGPPVHRLRDLDRRGRLWALAFAAALMLAPTLAFAWAAPDWVPANDPALMGLQALAVGSSDTPLTGQPSTSAAYVDESRHVDHLGPLHLYLLAGPMRLLGADIGMLAVSVLINGACLLIAAWGVFRRLDPIGGVIGAVILGLASFTVGAANLVDPVSSDMARLPLLCSAVLVWCLLRGDIRMLPLTTAVVSFAAQQHLSVLPAIAVLTVAGIVGLAYMWGRNGRWRERTAQRALAVWGGWSALVGLALWSPVLIEQITGRPGNLTMLLRLTGDSDRPTLGLASAVRQVANVVGLPPLLGQRNASGLWFLEEPSWFTWLSAGTVVALLGILGLHWRRTSPDRFGMVLMVGVLVVAGLANGANVLDGAEAWRLVMYHWAFPLAFFVALSLSLAAVQAVRWLLRRMPTDRPGWTLPALAGAALLAIAVPSLLNPALERESNTLVAAHSPIERRYIDALIDELMVHRERLDGEPIVMLSQGAIDFSGLRETVTLHLAEEQLDARLPPSSRWYVPDDRLADPEAVEAGLLIVEEHFIDDDPFEDIVVGELIAEVDTMPDLDLTAYRTLLAVFDGVDEVRLGPAIEAALSDLPEPWLRATETGDLADVDAADGFDLPTRAVEQAQMMVRLNALRSRPEAYLLDRELLQFLDDHPLEEPRLDPAVIERLLDGAPDELRADRPVRVRAYLLDRDELQPLAER